jgi:hypothetical protein
LLASFSLLASEHRGVVKFGGLPMPGATVTATQGDRRLTAVTDEQGAYSFASLTDGTWSIQVEMLCFEPIRLEVAVAPNAPDAEWDLKMVPFERIQASAPPPPPTPVAPAAASVAAAAVPAEPETPAAPAKRKNVPPPPPASAQSGFQRASVNAVADASKSSENGMGMGGDEMSAAPSDGFLINGSVNNGANSPFAQSNALGNSRPGARSLYNGNIGLIFDSSSLDARTYSITGQDTPKPAYDRLTGVLSFGGPIPRTRGANRPMFVLNYQWTHNGDAATADALVPTESQRAGNLGNGAAIPPVPQAAALLSLYPEPNFSGSGYNYQVPLLSSTHVDAMQARLNDTIGRRDQFNGILGLQSVRSANPNIFDFQDTSRALGVTSYLNWMHRFSQRVFLTWGLRYSRLAQRNTPFFAYRENISGEAGIAGNLQSSAYWGPPGLSFSSGMAGLSDGQASFTRNQNAGLSVEFFWNHEAHNVRYGFEVNRQQMNLLEEANARGDFAFTGAATGSDFGDFLRGLPSTVALAYGNADKYFRYAMWNAYVADDWRVSPGFTLNAGMRWEYGAPVTETYGRLVNLDVAPGFTAVAPVEAAAPSGSLTGARYPDSLIHPDKRGFEPRVGFAWHPMLASSLVVRGGYGIYYDTSVYANIARQMMQQSPLSKNLSIEGGGLTMATAFNAPPSNTPDLFGIDPNFRPGYSQNWQLWVQRDLPGSLAITAAYLGIKGTHGRQLFLPNTYPMGGANPCPECPAGFTYETSGGNSSRQSGQLQVRRRLRAGLATSATYTFSKAIDDAAMGGRGQGGSPIAQNWLDLAAERGLSATDQRHLLSLQTQYSTGAGSGALLSGWTGALFKEWTVAANINAGAGLPLTAVYFADVGRTACTGCIRPDYTGLPVYSAPPGLFLNPSAFTAPAPGRWGNVGRNTISGPSQFSFNASLGRAFSLGDRRNIELRFDATNALNHVTYPSWNTTINSSQFGLPTSADQMRSIRTTLRLRF